ncbi:MBL fold metallo-hydrolase [Belliella aquatica]|uniref:MBL fold metallo-hydrolase n=1 Tax=Belliella aquatica TaxID=1323734 RepID=A0ABQ1MB04_9BACT|nr:MBL fold metallo-hydrolase [Belliella aquatica]MCH7405648.1 MBL fold metallo-hydrolase [Belliella aquatica]GGC36663.1 MBL fold metallo-hydrolase [Belliella aquatica]
MQKHLKFIFSLIFGLAISFQSNAQFENLIKARLPQKSEIKQFEDDGLAHFSYAIYAEGNIILVDPGRNPQQYYDYAKEKNAKIVGVIETHPHADFVSSHLEIHQTTSAPIYISELVNVHYDFVGFDEGDVITLAEGVKLKALFTPGHSPDGISIVLEEDGVDIAVFTGDTLFIGDVGRPDLRESAGSIQAQRTELAKMMYHSTREKLMKLDDGVLVYPAHGAGSLCGKSLSTDKVSTIGQEKLSNYALQEMTEEQFVAVLLEDQPFIPKYFPYSVEVNREGAEAYQKAKESVKILAENVQPKEAVIIIDGRNQADFKASHIPDAINIMNGAKFETWLGSLVAPTEAFYLVADSEEEVADLISKTTKIGYEPFIKGAFVYSGKKGESMPTFDKSSFDSNPEAFTILDIRNRGEVEQNQVFENAINIPLPELMERAKELPTDKPIVVHCGTGYRSAAGSSIVHQILKGTKIIDMGSAIKEYNQ